MQISCFVRADVAVVVDRITGFHELRPAGRVVAPARMTKMARFLFCAFTVLLSGRLVAQMPTATFTSPTDGQTVTSASITITWKGCSNATQTNYTTRIAGVAIATTQSSTFPCPDYTTGKNYSASGTLANGLNYLSIHVCDISGCGDSTITVIYAGAGRERHSRWRSTAAG